MRPPGNFPPSSVSVAAGIAGMSSLVLPAMGIMPQRAKSRSLDNTTLMSVLNIGVSAQVHRSEEVMGEWQPIETAPKDGTPIMVCGGDTPVTIAFWSDGWIDDGEINPAYWMPLPSPPE